MKKAALFSALTNLAHAELTKLKWGDLEKREVAFENKKRDIWCIRYSRQKTKEFDLLPIPDQAFNILGEKGKPDEKVFPGLKYSSDNNNKLYDWVKKAGIHKK